MKSRVSNTCARVSLANRFVRRDLERCDAPRRIGRAIHEPPCVSERLRELGSWKPRASEEQACTGYEFAPTPCMPALSGSGPQRGFACGRKSTDVDDGPPQQDVATAHSTIPCRSTSSRVTRSRRRGRIVRPQQLHPPSSQQGQETLDDELPVMFGAAVCLESRGVGVAFD